MKNMKLNILSILAVGALICVPAQGEAFVALSGNGPLGSYSGSLDYSFTNSTTAQLDIILTNTSPVANGGYLTAFVFNNPFDYITGATLTPTDPDFGILVGAPNVNGAPYGQFDFGASTGGSFQGGGPPSRGIGVGDTETFQFSLTGNNLNSLTSQAFLDELSTGTGSGQGYQSFVARFRGFEDGGSDKVPHGGGNTPPPSSVPEPASMLLFGSGMLGFFARKKFAT